MPVLRNCPKLSKSKLVKFFRKTWVILDNFIRIGVLHSARKYFFISLKLTVHKQYKWSPGTNMKKLPRKNMTLFKTQNR